METEKSSPGGASPRRRLLILDLDETLIHATDRGLADGRPCDFRACGYHCYRRPHLDAFLAGCFARFDTAIWTSAGGAYAASAVARILPDGAELAFLWSAERCARRFDPEAAEFHWLKPLRKLRRVRRERGWRRGDILAVDDSPEKWGRSYGNLVRVRPFEGDPLDDELPRLLAYLEAIRDEPDYRALEKRNWRAHPAAVAATAARP